ncbi:MAG: type II secretion system protein GspL [Azoarcus sp.]
MTTRLLIRIDERWPNDPAADWVLLDAANRELQRGNSGPAHWPAADGCEGVLAGAQSTWLEVLLPASPRRERPRLLSYALEEHLVGDPDTQHVSVTHSRPEGTLNRTGVITVTRTRMAQILAQFTQIGRPLKRLCSALETVPNVDGRWVLAVEANGAILRPGVEPAIAFDAPTPDAAHAALSSALSIALTRRRASTALPAALELRVAEACTNPETGATGLLPLPVEPGPVWRWWEHVDATHDLLHGAFSARQGRDAQWRRLRVPAAIFAMSALALFLVSLTQVIGQRQTLGEIERRSARLFEQALPGTPAVAPAAQLGRALDRARRKAGQLSSDDLLALLHGHLAATGVTPLAIAYENGRLDLTLPPETDTPALLTRLAVHGLNAQRRDGGLVLSAERQP